MGLWQVFKLKAYQWYKKLMVKGYEHVTVMLIPHSEQKIFTFKISNFLLGFSFVIILLFTLGGSYLFVVRNNFERKISDLSLNYIKLLSVLETVKTHMDHVKDTSSKVLNITGDILDVVDVNPINKIYRSSYKGGPDNNNNEFLKPLFEDLHHLNDSEIKEVKNLLFLGKDLNGIYRNLNGLKGVLKNFKSIFKNIPSVFPVLGTNLGRGYVTSEFGWRRDPFKYRYARHDGIDIVNIPGTPVLSTADGYVKRAGRDLSKGIYVEIQHQYGYETRYYHLSSINVNSGRRILRGQIIGRIGSSGRSTGPHLHYEIRVNGKAINPKPFMDLDPFYR